MYLKRCPYCGSSLNDEHNDLQQRFRLHCHICQTDQCMNPIDNTQYIALRRSIIEHLMVDENPNVPVINNKFFYPSKRLIIQKSELLHFNNPLCFYTKYTKSSQALTQVLLLDTLVPIVGHLGINETGIQIQETDQMHFEGLQFLIGQVLPKYVKIKFDPKTKQN